MAIDCSQVKTALVTLLHASSDGTLIHWTADELYDGIDRAAQSLAERSLLLGASYLAAFSQGVGSYLWGLRFLHGSAVIANGQALPESPVEDLEALNPNWIEWEDTQPERYALDAEQRGTVRVVPKPSQTGALLQTIYRQAPAEISSGQTNAPFPSALSECLLWSALGDVLAKEGKGARPEMVETCPSLAALWVETAKEYYGVRKA